MIEDTIMRGSISFLDASYTLLYVDIDVGGGFSMVNESKTLMSGRMNGCMDGQEVSM
jgi:hypothetical protein